MTRETVVCCDWEKRYHIVSQPILNGITQTQSRVTAAGHSLPYVWIVLVGKYDERGTN